MVARLITVNTVVWIVISIGMLTINATQHPFWISLFALPSHISELPWHFWTIGTYMVAHVDFLHLFVNMMWLLLFGRLMVQMLGPRRLLWLYIGSGLAGALAFIISNLVAQGPYPYMLGASCAVIGVIGCSAMMLPNLKLSLLFLGDIKIIWIAVMAIVLFIFLEPSSYVSIAHAAGLIFGLGYAYMRRKGFVVHWQVNQFFNKLKQKATQNGTGKAHYSMGGEEQQLDRLLDKVHRSGYQSLSPSERQKLFELSQRIKK